jgi:RNA polymerase subunit RPABC4/transcription elongation factor Spt4
MSPELINNIATFAGVLVAGIGAFIFAFWVAMGIWTFNDIRSRTRDWLAILLAVLLVMVFPIVGLILYTLIRPKVTLADTYDRALEEEALLRELEETQACQACGVPVKENWIFCPNCHSQLQHSCPTCTNLVRNEWAICVYCGTPQRGTQTRELGARATEPAYQPGYQPAYQPAMGTAAARTTLDGQATPALGPSLSAAGASSGPGAGNAGGVYQPAPVQRRPGRNPFASSAGAAPAAMPVSSTTPPASALSAGTPSNASSLTPGGPLPMAEPSTVAPPYSGDYPDYDESPYRPARAGEG